MSRTITISDELYARLEAEARARGLDNIERLLEEREQRDFDLNEQLSEKSAGTADMIDRLLEHPIKMETFAPFTREEIYERP